MKFNLSRLALPYIEAFFAVLFWGASFVASKIAVSLIAPVTVVWLRFGIGVLILAAATILRGEMTFPGWRDLGSFTLLGLIGFSFHQWLQSNALVTSQATTSAWIVATAPVFMALLGLVVLKERLVLHQWSGIFLAGLGVLLVVSKGSPSGLSSGKSIQPGDWLMLLSALNWAVFSALSRALLLRHPAMRMLFFVMATGWLITTLQFLPGNHAGEILRLSVKGWLAILFLGVFCSGLAYIFWYDALKAIPSAQAGAFLYVEPLVTVLVSMAVLSEPVLWSTLAGGAVILIGLWLVNRRPRAGHPAQLDKPVHSE